MMKEDFVPLWLCEKYISEIITQRLLLRKSKYAKLLKES